MSNEWLYSIFYHKKCGATKKVGRRKAEVGSKDPRFRFATCDVRANTTAYRRGRRHAVLGSIEDFLYFRLPTSAFRLPTFFPLPTS